MTEELGSCQVRQTEELITNVAKIEFRERERAKDLQRRRKRRRFGIIEVGARGIGNIKARG